MSHKVIRKKRIPTLRDANQRHHDYYVTLERRGELAESERWQYDDAMGRERAGQVNPLPEDIESK